MFSSKDFELLSFQYHAEAEPKGVTIEEFCSEKNISYEMYKKWYDDTRHKVVEVEVLDVPAEDGKAQPSKSDAAETKPIILSFPDKNR